MTGILFPIESKTYLNAISFKKFDNTQLINSCPIMLTKFENGDDIAVLPCKHVFEKEAILTWIKKGQPTCPVCRYNIPPDIEDICSIILRESFQRQERSFLEAALNETLNVINHIG